MSKKLIHTQPTGSVPVTTSKTVKPAPSSVDAQTATPFSSMESAYGTGWTLADVPIFPKLVLSTPSDSYEQEAEAATVHVMNAMSRSTQADFHPYTVMRKTGAANFYLNRAIQNAERSDRESANDVQIHQQIQSAQGRGATIAYQPRKSLEKAFGADFSPVRVHTDAGADSLNRRLQAQAFTSGNDIFFRGGEYHPGSTDGQALLAHELTHVLQQSAVRSSFPGSMIQRTLWKYTGEKWTPIRPQDVPDRLPLPENAVEGNVFDDDPNSLTSGIQTDEQAYDNAVNDFWAEFNDDTFSPATVTGTIPPPVSEITPPATDTLFTSNRFTNSAVFTGNQSALMRADLAFFLSQQLSEGTGSNSPPGSPAQADNTEALFEEAIEQLTTEKQSAKRKVIREGIGRRFRKVGKYIRTHDKQKTKRVTNVSGRGRYSVSGSNKGYPKHKALLTPTPPKEKYPPGYEPRPNASKDFSGKGSFFLSHADKGTLAEGETIIGDSILMCEDCEEFTKREVVRTGNTIVTRDSPYLEHVFVPRDRTPNGEWGRVDKHTRATNPYNFNTTLSAETTLIAPEGLSVIQESDSDSFTIQFADGLRLIVSRNTTPHAPLPIRIQRSLPKESENRSRTLPSTKQPEVRKDGSIHYEDESPGHTLIITKEGGVVVRQRLGGSTSSATTELAFAPGKTILPGRDARLKHTQDLTSISKSLEQENVAAKPLPAQNFTDSIGHVWNIGEANGDRNQCLYDTVFQLARVAGLLPPTIQSVQDLRNAVAEEEAQWGVHPDHITGVLTNAEGTVDLDLQIMAYMFNMHFIVHLGIGGDALFGAQLPPVGFGATVGHILYTLRHFQPLWGG